jgi:arylsulfatase A-like enzyme
MSTRLPAAERPTAGLLIAVFGSELFLALSFLRVWGDANSLIFRTSIIDATLNEPIWDTALAWHIAAFVGALLLLHFVLGVAIWCLAKLSRRAWPNSGNSVRVWSGFWLVSATVWILLANATWFPSTALGKPYADFAQASLLGLNALDVATIAVGTVVAWVLGHTAVALWPFARRHAKWSIGALTAGGSAAAFASFGLPGHEPAVNRNEPHVIVIGLDSVRPDALYAPDGRNLAPALNEFLAGAVVFSDTLTPLARTFPSWTSIVSGKHPHSTGAVMNLLTRELIDEGDTLPRLLGEAGYRTVYATDEVRFSNLDQSYGFEEMLAPPMGAADFLVGFFSDSPFMNLLVNTRAGELLFPYAYANRAIATTYDPDTFVRRIANRVRFDEPTLLATHFTLVHWPYTWASTRPDEQKQPMPELYQGAVERLDRQFNDLLGSLRERGALDNAIVVVLSDHGESMGEPASVADDEHAKRHIRHLQKSVGHGTSVFARDQYRVLLAMRSFGAEQLPTPSGIRITAPASLEDITPTLTDALGLRPRGTFDGISWLPELRGAAGENRAARVRFMETEFSPAGFASGVVLTMRNVRGAAAYYRVDAKTGRVLIRAERLPQLLATRQYAAVRGEELLAAVPSESTREQHVLYVESPGSAPVWFSSPPTAGAPHELWNALSARFDYVRDRPVLPPSEGGDGTLR